MNQFINKIVKETLDIAVTIPLKYAIIHGQPLIFSMASSDSENPVELTFASINHFLNYTKVLLDNKTDQLSAKPISYITGKNNYLSANNIWNRNYNRLFETFRQNGGIYKEYLIVTRFLSPDYKKYNLNKMVAPKKINSSQQEEESKNELTEIFKASIFDFKHPFFNNFQIIQMESGADMPYTVLSGFLNNQKITLYFDKPKKRMMRKLDLFPFKLMYHLTRPIPQLKNTSMDLKSMIDRLDYDIDKEYKARMKLLNIYGIKTEGRDYQDILTDASSASLPFSIGIPQKEYTTKHIMITSGIDTMKLNIGYMFNSLVKSLNRKDVMIPNLSFNNVRQTETGKPSLISYASLTHSPFQAPSLIGNKLIPKELQGIPQNQADYLTMTEMYGNYYDYLSIDRNFQKSIFSNIYSVLKRGFGE